jgi:protein associated with RNAse G/E
MSNSFGCYYINFQLPFRRSHCGFDTLDLELDMVIDQTGAWRWKDMDDYEEAIQEGGMLPEWRQGIEKDKAEVFERLHQRRYPLDGAWLRWQPDPGWTAPALPAGWEET